LRKLILDLVTATRQPLFGQDQPSVRQDARLAVHWIEQADAQATARCHAALGHDHLPDALQGRDSEIVLTTRVYMTRASRRSPPRERPTR
jgi:hypothetical protein